MFFCIFSPGNSFGSLKTPDLRAFCHDIFFTYPQLQQRLVEIADEKEIIVTDLS